jgi:hypothetical protein
MTTRLRYYALLSITHKCGIFSSIIQDLRRRVSISELRSSGQTKAGLEYSRHLTSRGYLAPIN